MMRIISDEVKCYKAWKDNMPKIRTKLDGLSGTKHEKIAYLK